MRALFPEPGALNAATYRRFARRALFRGCMSGTMSSHAPYLNLNALVLTQRELDSLAELTVLFGDVFARAGAIVARDVDLLVGSGFPWSFAELLAEEPDLPFVLGRFDFLLDRSGRWQVVEYNSDTPSGLREGIAVDEVIFELLGPGSAIRRVNDVLEPLFIAAFRAALPPMIARPVVGFLTDAMHLEDTGQVAYTRKLVDDALGGAGVTTVFGDVKNLRQARGRRLTLVGRPIDALYRYYPYEAMLATPQFLAIVEAASLERVRLMNGYRGLLLQDKALMAWIWAHRSDPMFTPAEQRAIADHLPPTWAIREMPSDEPLAGVVVKQVFGREGEEVYLGERMTAEDWARCREWGTFVVQRRVASEPLPLAGWDWRGEPRASVRYPSVGSFVAGAEFAGIYTRVGGPILTSQAEFVPVFVEA